jgi:type I protein arginine methyltransferase
VKKNKLSKYITIIKGKCEDVELPLDPATNQPLQVDIIISEWMGYCLLYESMLPTVLYARDKWLKPGGLILPDKYRMVVAGCSDTFKLKKEKEAFWNNVYGVDMSCLGKNFYVEPLVENVPRHTIVTDSCVFKEFDLNTCTQDELVAGVNLVAH